MFKKIIALFITMAMMVCLIPQCMQVNAQSMLDTVRSDFATAVERDSVKTTTEYEGNEISCIYYKKTQEYVLKLNDLEYPINVSIEDGNIMVDIFNEKVDENCVYGQNPALLAIPLIPEVVATVETCVTAVVATAVTVEATYLSMELIDNVLVPNAETFAQVEKSVADAAVSTMASVSTIKTEYDESYFEAAIDFDNDSIFIGRLLTYKEALVRLKLGYDLFAVDMTKAHIIAKIASPSKQAKGPEFHEGSGERFWHYHPIGVSWYKNRRHYPHVWYM